MNHRSKIFTASTGLEKHQDLLELLTSVVEIDDKSDDLDKLLRLLERWPQFDSQDKTLILQVAERGKKLTLLSTTNHIATKMPRTIPQKE